MGISLLLVSGRQGCPGVPFMLLFAFPKGISGWVVPLDPLVIIRSEPFTKRGHQLMVRVARDHKQGLEHGLPGCFGILARGLGVGPLGTRQDGGVSDAVPHSRVDVGACCIA